MAEVEAHLMTENAPGPGAGAVALDGTVLQNVLHEVEILTHAGILSDPSAEVKAGVLCLFGARVGTLLPSVGKTVQVAHPGIALAAIPEVESTLWP